MNITVTVHKLNSVLFHSAHFGETKNVEEAAWPIFKSPSVSQPDVNRKRKVNRMFVHFSIRFLRNQGVAMFGSLTTFPHLFSSYIACVPPLVWALSLCCSVFVLCSSSLHHSSDFTHQHHSTPITHTTGAERKRQTNRSCLFLAYHIVNVF